MVPLLFGAAPIGAPIGATARFGTAVQRVDHSVASPSSLRFASVFARCFGPDPCVALSWHGFCLKSGRGSVARTRVGCEVGRAAEGWKRNMGAPFGQRGRRMLKEKPRRVGVLNGPGRFPMRCHRGGRSMTRHGPLLRRGDTSPSPDHGGSGPARRVLSRDARRRHGTPGFDLRSFLRNPAGYGQ